MCAILCATQYYMLWPLRAFAKPSLGKKKLHMTTPTSKPFSAIIFRISSPPKKSEKQLTFSVMILVAILASIGTLSGLVLNGK
jgi:hypothetical protein